MEGTEYRVMLSGSDRYYVELTRQGESSCTTCDFATQSAAQDWIDQDREREGVLDGDGRWHPGAGLGGCIFGGVPNAQVPPIEVLSAITPGDCWSTDVMATIPTLRG